MGEGNPTADLREKESKGERKREALTPIPKSEETCARSDERI
jgi:hypothetical protein